LPSPSTAPLQQSLPSPAVEGFPVEVQQPAFAHCCVPLQAFPQLPQFCESLLASEQLPLPQHWGCTPPHWIPHPPQLRVSVVVSTQLSLQAV
jgi:hypothetical protein